MSHMTSKYRSTPTFSFKSRNLSVTSSNKPDNIPSPQDYEIDQYNVSKCVKPYGKFSKNKKLKQDQQAKSISPGPGSYQFGASSVNISSFHKGETIKKGESRFKGIKGEVPGPNQYSPNQNKFTSLPKYSIGKHKSMSFFDEVNSSGPAPNLYNPENSLIKNAVSFSIGMSNRKDNVLPGKFPGPCSYHTEKIFQSKSFNQKKDILSKSRRQNTNSLLQFVPGPGAYHHQRSFTVQNKSRDRGFTWKRRNSEKIILTPGPSFYNNEGLNHKYSSNGVKLARSVRKFLVEETRRSTQIPGAGNYQSNMAQKFRFKSASASKFPKQKLPHFVKKAENTMEFINPEKYAITKQAFPKFSIPSSKKRGINDQILKQESPDKFYDTKANKLKYTQNSFKIPQAERMKGQKPSNIGPDHYNGDILIIPPKKRDFSKAVRKTFLDVAVEQKLKTFTKETYQSRQQFPNPPKYMNVHKKIAINEHRMSKY